MLRESGLPLRLAGVKQRGSPEMPAERPGCHTAPPAWRLIPRERPVYGSCILCGSDRFRTSRRVIRNDASREDRSLRMATLGPLHFKRKDELRAPRMDHPDVFAIRADGA